MAQLFSHGHQQLGTNQVNSSGNFSYGVLNLNTRVHFDKVVVVVLVYQEFHSTNAYISNFLSKFYCFVPQLFQGGLWNGEGGSEFHNLLVTALEGTVSLIQVNDVTVAVCKNLNFDVLGLHQELFHEDGRISKGLAGFFCYQLEGLANFLVVVAGTHSTSTTTSCCLQDNWVAVAVGTSNGIFGILQWLGASRNGGNITAMSKFLCTELVSHLAQNIGRWSDKDNVVPFTSLGEFFVFRQESVSRVDGIGSTFLCKGYNLVNGKIGSQGSQ